MALISVKGVDIPTPSSYQVGIMDISNAERNAKGNMMIERIATKRKIELSWNYLSDTELKTLLNQIDGVFFTVDFIDPQKGATSGTFYVGDRTISAMDYINGNIRWKDISFNFVEK